MKQNQTINLGGSTQLLQKIQKAKRLRKKYNNSAIYKHNHLKLKF